MKISLATLPAYLVSRGIPEPVAEWRIVPHRRYAFDFAWPEGLGPQRIKTALEIEGGIFGRGKKCPVCGRRGVAGHTSIQRLLGDMRKYNLAASLGWAVIRCVPKDVESGKVVSWLERLLKGGGVE